MSVTAILFGILAMLGQSVAQAQDLPIRSQDEIRQYTMKHCVSGWRSVYSDSIDWNNTNNMTYASAKGAFGEEILASIFDVKMRYAIINTNDNVRSYAGLNDKDGNTFFYGYAEYAIGENPQIGMWMQSTIVGPTNVSWAEILVLNEDGETADRINVELRNGQMVFPWWYAGAPNGILVAHLNDGTTLKYDLWNPSPEQPDVNVDMSAQYKVDNHYIYRFDGNKEAVVKIIEAYDRPSAYLELSKAQEVTFDVLGLYYNYNDGSTAFERSQSMVVEDQATGVKYDVQTAGNTASKSKLPAGKYRIIWNWLKFGQPNTIYYGGGGKG